MRTADGVAWRSRARLCECDLSQSSPDRQHRRHRRGARHDTGVARPLGSEHQAPSSNGRSGAAARARPHRPRGVVPRFTVTAIDDDRRAGADRGDRGEPGPVHDPACEGQRRPADIATQPGTGRDADVAATSRRASDQAHSTAPTTSISRAEGRGSSRPRLAGSRCGSKTSPYAMAPICSCTCHHRLRAMPRMRSNLVGSRPTAATRITSSRPAPMSVHFEAS